MVGNVAYVIKWKLMSSPFAAISQLVMTVVMLVPVVVFAIICCRYLFCNTGRGGGGHMGGLGMSISTMEWVCTYSCLCDELC